MADYDFCVYHEGQWWVLKNCSGVEENRAKSLDELLENATRGVGRNGLREKAIREAVQEAGETYGA